MRRLVMFSAPVLLWLIALGVTAGAHTTARQPQGSGGWTLPADAATQKSPVPATPAAIAAGKKLFTNHCQHCHGLEGKGDGPDADPKNQSDMDLTVASRAARNPDGVVFNKLWNGRSSPKMPAMNSELTKEQAWALVAYVQTLRAK